MEDKKIIASALLELAKKSKTQIIKEADKEMIESAKRMGIELPSPDLSLFSTVYAEIDKVNLNGVILSRKSVEDGIQTLVGKQVNWEHEGSGSICGFILSAKINGDNIEIIGVLFKSMFPEEMQKVEAKFEKGELAVSFELWGLDPENGEKLYTVNSKKQKVINKFIASGCGLLLVAKPGCPKAKVYHLMAKKETEKIFDENLICASLAVEKSECKNCGICTCEKGGENKVEEIKKEDQVKAEEVKKEEKKEEMKPVCSECKKELKENEKEICAECKEKKEKASTETKEEKPVETAQTLEKKDETATAEEKVENNKEEQLKAEGATPKVVVKVTTMYIESVINTYENGTPSGVFDKKAYNKTITEYSDGTKDEIEEVVDIVKKYELAELEAEVNKVKAEKDVEIAKVKEELENTKKENEVFKAKEEEEKKKVEEATLKADLKVGNVVKKDNEHYRSIQEAVNKRAFGTKKQ